MLTSRVLAGAAAPDGAKRAAPGAAGRDYTQIHQSGVARGGPLAHQAARGRGSKVGRKGTL